MQLIEIVQLALIGFVTLILIIFFVSYVSYKTRKKIKMENFNYKSNIINNDPKFLDTFTSNIKKKIEDSPSKENKPQKFQVFNPNLSNSGKKNFTITKKHFPHTLFIKK